MTYRPPKYIAKRLKKKSDDADVRCKGFRFFYGVTSAKTRVTFEYENDWYFVDRSKDGGNDLFEFLSNHDGVRSFSVN